MKSEGLATLLAATNRTRHVAIVSHALAVKTRNLSAKEARKFEGLATPIAAANQVRHVAIVSHALAVSIARARRGQRDR